MNFHAEIAMPGRFSVYNALTAIAICRHFKVSEADICKALLAARVKGRIEMVKVSNAFTLMIDYAHNAMALKSLLTTLKEYEHGRLVCVFGCGGNRSRERRFEMGEVSGNLADFTIITSDNPRFEEPEAIIEDIITGMKRQMASIFPSRTAKKPLPMRSTTDSPATSLCSPVRDTRIIRKLRV